MYHHIESVVLALKIILVIREAIIILPKDLVPSETSTTLLLIVGMDIHQVVIYQTEAVINLRPHQLVLATAIAVLEIRLIKVLGEDLIRALDQSKAPQELKIDYILQVEESEEVAVLIFMDLMLRME